MEINVFPNPEEVARQAAHWIVLEAKAAAANRGQFTLAVSGGRTPWKMLRSLAGEDMPSGNLHVFQVDERVAPPGHPDRNLTQLQESLAALGAERLHLHAMPVNEAELETAAGNYARLLNDIAGAPPVLDVIHLGLGEDGHTASLVPGDHALQIQDQDVALTAPYQNRRRLTLTYPVLNRARRILWVVTGAEKEAMLARLLSGDRSIPAGHVERSRAILFVDRAAAGAIPSKAAQ